MQLKSYLRGLGCGLFISAVLMGIAVSFKKDTMSDEEVRMRATELGMVDEASVLVKPAKEAETAVVKIEDNTDSSDSDVAKDKADSLNNDAENREDKEKEDESGSDVGTPDEQDPVSQETHDETVEEPETFEEPAVEEEPAAEEPATEEEAEPVEVKDPEETEPRAEPAVTPDIKTTETITLEIAKGTTSDGVAGLLARAGVIDSASDFDDYLCRNRYDKKIHSGIFKIPPGASYQEIADIITKGN